MNVNQDTWAKFREATKRSIVEQVTDPDHCGPGQKDAMNAIDELWQQHPETTIDLNETGRAEPDA